MTTATHFTHIFRIDGLNHAIVNTRRYHKGRGVALCGADLTGSLRRPTEQSPLGCGGCVAEHTKLFEEGEER